ncbi:F-box domain containing protein [Quillaja saponaria]|uniref:F-box domain containing protein n=1 Tax=Quillaja saponaria TaxID=32244 RepID=A0AAD7LMJ5_QUISA|nr:F-box domain containing protein [Quillaja saponaria]KAJ7960712.1 F-box domain containing protein [Quillaja saponaria]
MLHNLNLSSKQEKAAMAIDPPEDLVINILSRLPAKSLIRFRSVSKSWDSLIRNPGFISAHLSHQNSIRDKGGSYFLVKHRSYLTHTDVISLLSSRTYNVVSSFEVPTEMGSKFVKIVGSCNGLLCVSHDSISNFGSSIFLWNPAIRRFRVLPKCNIYNVNLAGEKVHGVAHGFGYYAVSNDYKLVRIVYLYCFDRPCFRAEIYSLRMDSWKEIDAVDCRIYESSCIAINGGLHWVAHGGGVKGREVIMSFEMHDEVFRKIAVPDYNVVRNEICMKLTVFQESLCLIIYSYGRREKWFDLWVMIEQDAQVFWDKRQTTGPIFGVERPLHCGMHGEIFLEKGKGKLVLYDPGNKEIKDLSIHGILYTLDVHIHMESLVSINLSNDVDDDYLGRDFVTEGGLLVDELQTQYDNDCRLDNKDGIVSLADVSLFQEPDCEEVVTVSPIQMARSKRKTTEEEGKT